MGNDTKEQEIVTFLQEVVGRDYVSVSIYEKIKQSVDAFPYHVNMAYIPHSVVLPENREQISRILKYANKEKVPVFIRGSGTQLAGSSRPHTPGIMINTRRMREFILSEDYGFIECEPGLRNREILDLLAERGWFLPQLVGSALIASLGGLTSNNSSGHVIDAAVGKISDYIYGLEVVLPTGEIIETGTKGMRRPAGTDLTKYFVGGDGLLGVITKIRYRLVPLQKQAYGIAVFKDLKPIARGVKRTYLEKTPAPLFMEFMDHNVSTIAYKLKEMEPPPGPIIFFVGLGEDEEIAQKKMNRVLDVFKGENPIEAYQITDLVEWKKLWSAREVIAPYLMKANEGLFVTSELVSSLAKLEEAMEEGSRYQEGIPDLKDMTNYYFGHIGALTMHPCFVLSPKLEEEKLRRIVNMMFEKEKEFNLKYSTCGGEWGQFSKRKDFFVERYGELAYELVKKIKAVFDPNNILNPGILEGYR